MAAAHAHDIATVIVDGSIGQNQLQGGAVWLLVLDVRHALRKLAAESQVFALVDRETDPDRVGTGKDVQYDRIRITADVFAYPRLRYTDQPADRCCDSGVA